MRKYVCQKNAVQPFKAMTQEDNTEEKQNKTKNSGMLSSNKSVGLVRYCSTGVTDVTFSTHVKTGSS